MTRTVLSSCAMVAMLLAGTSVASAEGNEVGMQTLTLQNEAFEPNDGKSGATAKRATRNVKGASEETRKAAPPSGARYDGKYVIPPVRHTFGGQGQSKSNNETDWQFLRR